MFKEQYVEAMAHLSESMEQVARLTKLVAQHQKDYAHQLSRRREAERELRELKAKHAESVEEIIELNHKQNCGDDGERVSPFPHISKNEAFND